MSYALCIISVLSFFFSWCCDLRDIQSFPTRRSSDLVEEEFLGFLHRRRCRDHFRELANPRLNPAVLDCFVDGRSEEHTSEPSHVAISYAVFCLKKKITADHNYVIH